METNAYIHLCNNVFFPLDVSSVVQLSGLWKKMAAHPRTCDPEPILLVSEPDSLYLKNNNKKTLLFSSSKFCLLWNAETVVCVPHQQASDIDGLEQGV